MRLGALNMFVRGGRIGDTRMLSAAGGAAVGAGNHVPADTLMGVRAVAVLMVGSGKSCLATRWFAGHVASTCRFDEWSLGSS